MKIVLVNPRSRNPREIQQKCFAPLNLMYLAAALQESGYSVDIIDANALGWNDAAVAERIKSLAPDLVGISLLSEIYRDVFHLSKAIRAARPGVFMVLGGPHANALPEIVLEEFKAADLVLRGECEQSIIALCEALNEKKSLATVPGLTYRRAGQIRSNPPSRAIRDIDRLEAPARHLLAAAYDNHRYFMILEKQRPMETVLTSRGCPFHCRFCSNIPARFRARSPENVLDELVTRYDEGIRTFDIADANFTHDPDRAMAIFELIIKEKLDISFRFKTRTDAVTERLLQKAGRAGARLVSMGMESGSQSILDRMDKRTTTAGNFRAARLVMKSGLKLNTGWILGFPGETRETLEETVDLIVKLKPTTANIGWLIPYPGTPVYEEARANQTLAGDWSLSSEITPWIKLPWLRDVSQIRKISQWARRKVYFRPWYLINFSGEILKNANLTLAAYALQEGKKALRQARPDIFR
ncbi:MAG: B12-binding domain-containing radical SAM protein [Desulfosudaceae bacterium]